ncbi:hypothetical protein NGM37_30255, partial [Streptomyces sp. TRM76130]|nr:hypothetical protein [Streptomyces sp. TRM76130]
DNRRCSPPATASRTGRRPVAVTGGLSPHRLSPYGLSPYGLSPYGLSPYGLSPYGLSRTVTLGAERLGCGPHGG